MSNAQWVNFPMTGNTNSYNWEGCVTNWLQLCAALDEHYKIAGLGNGFLGYITNVYTVPAGYTNAVVALTNGHSFTNRILCYTNIIMTNMMPHAYTYNDAEGSHTSTGYPYLTRSLVNYFDYYLTNLVVSGNWLMTNKMVGGTFDDWFEGDGSGTNSPSDFPYYSVAGLFASLGIGHVTNISTNQWGIITNGDAYFTRYPPISGNATQSLVIFESAYPTNGVWTTNIIQSLVQTLADEEWYTPLFNYGHYWGSPPRAYYHKTAAQALSVNVTFYGQELIISNQTTTQAEESITFTGEGFLDLTKVWYSVTAMVGTAAMNTNDSIDVVYTSTNAVYGTMPFVMYAVDFDERWKFLDSLRVTGGDPQWFNSGVNATNSYKSGASLPESGYTWDDATASAMATTTVWGAGENKAYRLSQGALNNSGPPLYSNYYQAVVYAGSRGLGGQINTYNTNGTDFIQSKVHFYTKTALPISYGVEGSNVWYSLQEEVSAGYGTTNYYKELPETMDRTNTVTAITVGGDTEPSVATEWPDAPTTNNRTVYKGYQVSSALVYEVWDALPGGIKWK